MNTRLEKTYTYLAAAICLSIPFMTYAKAFVNVTMICLFGILILVFKKDKIIALLNQRYLKIFFVFLIFVILFSFFNQSFFNDVENIISVDVSDFYLLNNFTGI